MLDNRPATSSANVAAAHRFVASSKVPFSGLNARPLASYCAFYIRRATLAVVLTLVAVAWARDDDAVAPLLDGGHETKGLRAGFFTSAGERVARLSIDQVGLEYRTQGFLRVAWRPIVVLDGVTLEVANPAATWPEQGLQILQAMRTLGGRSELILRRVKIRLTGAADIDATTARIRTDGGLELTMPAAEGRPDAGLPHIQYFWLTGPQAGRLTQTAPPHLAAATPPSFSTVK
jgi:hypothetical protein